MNEQLKRLRELQELDLERDALHETTDKLREKLHEATSFLEALNADLEVQKAQLDETRGLLGSKRSELAEAEQRLNDAKNKLHNVTNSREYAAAERELEAFKKIQAQLDEENTQLRGAIDEAESSIAIKATKIEELRSGLDEEQSAVDVAAADAEQRSVAINAKHRELAKSIQPDIIARYRFIRSRRSGKAIVAAVDGACTGCFMRLPPQAYIELQRGTTLNACQNCNRILYYVSADAGSNEPTANAET